MTDEEIANLLGRAPAANDPVFRYDVFARVAARARRRTVWVRAARTMAAFTGLGLFFGLMQAAGLSLAAIQPLFYAIAFLGLTYLLATEAVKGPRSLLARSFSALRFR